MDYKIFWTQEAVRNFEDIVTYLENKWTQREVVNFKLKLSRQIDLISQNPKMFPISSYQPRLRKAVLSKQTSIYYELKSKNIYLTYIFVNYKNVKRIK